MTRRFCDRHANRGETVEINMEGVPHVDLIPESDEDAGGNITDDWDLCDTCASLFRRFMDGVKLEGEGS
jgi:hypothetical protein